MSDSIPYTAIIGRVKDDIDYIAEQAYVKGYNSAKAEIVSTKEYEQAYQRGREDAERKSGEWKIEHEPYMVGSKNLVEVIICSNCRYVLQGYPSKFCPNCGSHMRCG